MTATYTYNPGKAHTTANYPLLDNSHHHPTRQGKTPLFCGIHITAGIDDFDGNDGSAEAAILYGRTTPRPASWWAIVDSDTARDCLPDEYTAFLQGVPDSGYSYNREGWGIEIGAERTDWAAKPAAWVEATLRNAARVIAPRAVRYGWKIKQRKDSIDAFTKADRKDMADKEAAEIVVLQGYLPARMSNDEVLVAVKAIVASLNASGPGDMGKVMGAAKAQLAGKADMGQVSQAVKAALAG